MPRIFDNIEQQLLPALRDTIGVADRADFCVGYFNLRGWRQIDSYIEQWAGGPGNCCRLLVGMQRLPQDELREALGIIRTDGEMDNQTANRLKKKLAEEFRLQLTMGVPTNEDEAGLRRLAAQIRAKKVVVKLFLRHQLHAKLYLLFRPDPINPAVGYVGSSNLTFAGLSNQGELNVDVMDGDACQKLAKWFEDRWQDRWCIDISDDLAQIIEESWARPEMPLPYWIYLKIAYHLSQEAREGLVEFRIPSDFGRKLFPFQIAAVKIAAHHLNKRGGVLVGDVVGLGKTLMATALARIFEDDHGLETLILCPKNLVPMWEDHRHQYRLRATIIPFSRVAREFAKREDGHGVRRHRLVLIDESHNLRNRQGKRYRAIQEYIRQNDSKVILLSATPYNKTYLDLANQLRLFILEDHDIGIRPECKLREPGGEVEFIRQHQCPVRSLAAFEKSDYADDWRELMRLYLVRRTRSFIQDSYAFIDCGQCASPLKPDHMKCPRCQAPRPSQGRKYLIFEDGSRSYFPIREPKVLKFSIADDDPHDQYAQLYAEDVVVAVNRLNLPRYGLGNYVAATPHQPPTPNEAKVLDDLSRAGKRLMGFCRTNLFKRLESSGQAFLQSVERHVLRNYIYLHAIETKADLPIGTQDSGLLDARIYDEDADATDASSELFDDDGTAPRSANEPQPLRTEEDFKRRAAEIYDEYVGTMQRRFKWLRADLFIEDLANDLRSDSKAMMNVLRKAGDWNAAGDAKLNSLVELLTTTHPQQKVLVFTQFADTVRYLSGELRSRGVRAFAGVTGDTDDPTAVAWRFSPESNNKRDKISPDKDLRVVIATDVLSEGQNLQDAAIIVNYDLPWAIIRLIQRAGRVDRIGQKADRILCYSFLPADGVERIIRLRARVRQRLYENAEVVGSDEHFFEDDRDDQAVRNLFTEKAGILDGDADTEVDLASYAYQIWKNAIDRDPSLEKAVANLPDVVYSTKPHTPREHEPEGALVYVRTAQDNDALAWVNTSGSSVTESQFAILKAAECAPDTPAIPRHENHHAIVQAGVQHIAAEERTVGGQLGRPSGARFRTYERLKNYAAQVAGSLFDTDDLKRAIEDIYRYPLRPVAVDTLNRQLRSGIDDAALTSLVIELRRDGRLCVVSEEEQRQEPRIICSLGLRAGQ